MAECPDPDKTSIEGDEETKLRQTIRKLQQRIATLEEVKIGAYLIFLIIWGQLYHVYFPNFFSGNKSCFLSKAFIPHLDLRLLFRVCYCCMFKIAFFEFQCA